MLNRLMTRYLRHINRDFMTFRDTPGAVALPEPVSGRQYLLYVHIPFCRTLCPFCSFHRVMFRKDKSDLYFEALRSEIRLYRELGFEFSEVYVGGGTPTVDLDQLAATLRLVRDLFGVERISTETNPDHLRGEIFEVLRDAGVNRLSVGVQSFDDSLLREMDRYDAYGSGETITRRLRDANGVFDTLNVDMIFNVPHQNSASLARDIEIIRASGVDQVSFYPLMSATSAKHRMDKIMGRVDYDREEAFYYQIHDGLADLYTPSSAWCFSRAPGMIDEYIVDHEEYVGVGSGAFSYLNGRLFATSFSIMRYDEIIDQARIGITRERSLTRHEQLQYHFLMTLFGLTLDKASAKRRFGDGYFRELWKEFLVFRALGGLRDDGDQYELTRRGRYFWVMMMREFFTGVNNFRDEMRAHIKEEYEASYGSQPVRILERSGIQ